MNKIVTGLSLAVAMVIGPFTTAPFTPTADAQPARGTATAEAPNTLRAGPMVGDVDMHNASIWLLTERPGAVEVEFWPLAAGALAAQGPANVTTRRVQVQTDAQLAPGTAIARLTGLQAGQAYGYRVWLDGRQQEPSLSFRTHARWQFRQGVHAPEVRVMLSSCTYINETARDRDGTPYGGDYEIFGAMAQAKPDLTVWMGDNVYYRENDYTSAEGMAHRWRHDRALPELQPLLRTGRHVATWDDHDFGPNDSNSSFSLKGAALDIFKRQWANRSWGLPEAPGVFGNFMESDIEFFLLDGRYHRDSDRDKDNPDKTMLGSAQLRWLKNALLASTATFKVIVSGSQVLNDPQRFEGWHNFKAERDGFLKWLQENAVRGVIITSGDRHHTELLRLPRAGTYPLHELTCSPTTAGAGRNAKPEHPAIHVPGTFVNQRNFCTLDVAGTRGQRTLTLKSWDIKGKELWSQVLREQDLR